MAEAVYAIEDFPADEVLANRRIGGVGYNANVQDNFGCNWVTDIKIVGVK